MRICQQCLGRFGDDASLCPSDSAALLPLGAGDPIFGTVIAGRYLILDEVGRGGMGVVYRAQQLSMRRTVALKVIAQGSQADPQRTARFVREAQTTAALQSSHTVTVHDFGALPDGSMFLAMELLAGTSLAGILESEGRIEPARAARLLIQICASLEEAHGKRVLHRDLKPGNVVVERLPSGEEHVKVVDFGLAKVLDEVTPGITQAGSTCGTPHYMSPELCTGAKDIGPPTDLYALGIMFYELLAGQVPYTGGSLTEIWGQHVMAPLPRLAKAGLLGPAHAACQRVLDRCLAKKPGDRYATAAEVRRDLEGIASSSSSSIDIEVVIEPTAPSAKRLELGKAEGKAEAPQPAHRSRELALGLAALGVTGLAWLAFGLRVDLSPAKETPNAVAALATETSTTVETAKPTALPVVTPPPAPAEVPPEKPPVRAAAISLGEVTVRGPMDPPEAKRRLAAISRDLVRCHRESRAGTHTLSIQLLVGATGAVSSALIRPEGELARRYDACARSSLLGLRFPAFTGAFATISTEIGP